MRKKSKLVIILLMVVILQYLKDPQKMGIMGIFLLKGNAGFISSTVPTLCLGRCKPQSFKGTLPKIRVPYFGVLIIRILLCRILY